MAYPPLIFAPTSQSSAWPSLGPSHPSFGVGGITHSAFSILAPSSEFMEEDPTVLTPTGASTPLTLLTFPPRRRIFYRGAVAKVAAARMAKGKGKGLESPPLSLRERSLIRTAKMANLVAPDHLRFTIVSLKATGKPHLLPLLPPPDAERVEALIGTSIDVDAPAPDKRAHEDNGSSTQGGNPSKKIKTEGTEVFGKKGRSSSSSGSRSVIHGPANHKKPPCGLKRQKACDLNLVVRLQKQLQAEVGDARRAPLGIGAPPAAAMPLHNGKVFRFGQGSSQGPFPIPSFHCSAEAFRVEETPLAASQDSEMDIDTIAASISAVGYSALSPTPSEILAKAFTQPQVCQISEGARTSAEESMLVDAPSADDLRMEDYLNMSMFSS